MDRQYIYTRQFRGSVMGLRSLLLQEEELKFVTPHVTLVKRCQWNLSIYTFGLLGGSSQDLDTWLITMVIVYPLRIGLWDPFQMAFLWLTNGGDPNHLHPLGWSSKYIPHPGCQSSSHKCRFHWDKIPPNERKPPTMEIHPFSTYAWVSFLRGVRVFGRFHTVIRC